MYCHCGRSARSAAQRSNVVVFLFAHTRILENSQHQELNREEKLSALESMNSCLSALQEKVITNNRKAKTFIEVERHEEKAKEYQKEVSMYFYQLLHKTTTTLDYVNHIKLWKVLRNLGILEHFIVLVRNVYTGQETTV